MLFGVTPSADLWHPDAFTSVLRDLEETENTSQVLKVLQTETYVVFTLADTLEGT